MRHVMILMFTIGAALLCGCERTGGHAGAHYVPAEGKDAHSEHDGHAAADAHGEHVAPHGGVLTAVGDHAAQIELLIRPEERSLRLFVLDGCAETSIRLVQSEIAMNWAAPGSAQQTLTFRAVESALTGERTGDSSEFAAELPGDFGGNVVVAVIPEITIRGVRFENVRLTLTPGGHDD